MRRNCRRPRFSRQSVRVFRETRFSGQSHLSDCRKNRSLSLSRRPGVVFAMRVLVIGATGLIGSAVVARLLDRGYEVRALARRTARAQRSQPDAAWVSFDIAVATHPEDWRSCLDGI